MHVRRKVLAKSLPNLFFTQFECKLLVLEWVLKRMVSMNVTLSLYKL